MPLLTFRSKYQGICRRTGRYLYDFIIKVVVPGGETLTTKLESVTRDDLVRGTELTAKLEGKELNLNLGKVGPTKKSIRASVTRQERRTAEALGGHRQTGSGARRGYKGDGRVEGRFRIENKMTQAESIRVKLSDLQKIRSECEGSEVPIFEVEFRERGTLRPIEKWALVPWAVLKGLVDEAGND